MEKAETLLARSNAEIYGSVEMTRSFIYEFIYVISYSLNIQVFSLYYIVLHFDIMVFKFVKILA